MNFGVWKRKISSAAQNSAIQSMGGVGIVFLQAPDKSLFVKSLVEGSGASHSGIKLGDCLMKVVYLVLSFDLVFQAQNVAVVNRKRGRSMVLTCSVKDATQQQILYWVR
jgi:C-terminal processing protease CtpA/Prc